MTTTEVQNVDGDFVVHLRGLNIENDFFNTQLTLNEDETNFYEKLYDIHYKKTVMKLHDAGC